MSSIRLTEQDITPDDSNEGQIQVYAKTDGNLYSKRGDSPETLITTVSAGQGWKHDKPNNKVYLVNSDDKVGIGTTSPSQKLDVACNIVCGTAAGTLYFGGDDHDQYISGDATSNYMTFSTGNAERVRINSGGNVGIGTTSPSEKLHVDGAVKSTTTAKAWIATGEAGQTAPTTIKSSYNVSSITEGSTCYYYINFTNAMADNDYVAVAKSTRDGNYTDMNTMVTIGPKTTTQLILRSGAAGYGHGCYGAGTLNVIVFGN